MAHHKGKDGRCNGQYYRFGKTAQHIENAAVPCLRGRTTLLDSDIGPANVLHYTNDGEDYILSANREIDEIALYKVEK